MAKRYRRALQTFIPDPTDTDLESAVATEEMNETVVETIEDIAYKCTACFDHFTVAEVNGNTNDCPSCKETDVLMEA